MRGRGGIVGLLVVLASLVAGVVAPGGGWPLFAWPAYAQATVQANPSTAGTLQPSPVPAATPVSPAPSSSASAPSTQTTATDGLALGVIVDTTDPASMRLAREAGFSHAKMVLHWHNVEAKRGRYAWLDTTENDLDNLMKAARAEDMRLVIRVDGVPEWAGGSAAKANLDAVEAFYAAMAEHGQGTIAAYEILNEPNLPFEWGGAPSPSGYTAFLKAAYRGVKKSDPSALVLGGGLSPATGGAGGTIEDVDFLQGMYAAGARGAMDALAVHNYGGNTEPERDPGTCSICFRRAELYRQVMVEQGDTATPIWATEYGWLVDSGRDMGQYDWMKVSADQQADYLVRSFRYARANWPWMTGLLVSNLDASTSPYHTGPQDGMPWFAILNQDHSPRPAWRAIKVWREQDLAQAAARRAVAPSSAATSTPAAVAPQPAGGAQAAATPVPSTSSAAGSPMGAEADSASPADGSATGGPAASPGDGGTGTVAVVAPTFETAASTQAAATASRQTGRAAPATMAPDADAAVEPAASETAATPRVRVARTDGTGVNLRARPSAASTALTLLPEGTALDIVGADVQAEGRTWRNVRTSGGRTGWVAAQYLSAP